MTKKIINRLMLEFCPDEMTAEQVAKHQKRAPEEYQK